MKNITITSLTILLLVSGLAAVDFSNRDMIIRMNGHDHYVHDFVSDTLNRAYMELADTLRQDIIDYLDSFDHISDIDVKEPPLIESIKFSHLTDSTGKVIVKISDWDIDFDFGSCPYNCNMDIEIEGKIKTEIDSSFYYLELYDIEFGGDFTITQKPETIVEEITCWINGMLTPVYLTLLQQWGFLQPMELEIDDYKHKLFAISELPGSLTDPAIVQEMINSFPISFSFDYYNETDKNLLISMDFMEGTETNPTAFQGIEPDPVQNESFDHIGFCTFKGSFEHGFSNWDNLPPEIDTPMEKATFLLDKMEELHMQSVKLEISWNDIKVPGLSSDDVNCGLNPDILDTPAGDLIIENFINNGAWGTMDSIISLAQYRKIDVILQIGSGNSPIKVENKPMAPCLNPVNSPGDLVYYVDEESYLYYLKLFAKASVRRYANDIGIWLPENEINVARYNYLCGWWREGDLWVDDSEGGFNDKVWDVLIKAINDEDPSAKIVHNFHMMNLVNGIQRYGEDIDIIGLNLYPNQLFARPVLGFSIGELIWATRRMLKGLGWNKDIWITETNYPGMFAGDPPTNISLAEDVKYFSYSRQSEYLSDAINSALDNGSKGFLWFSFWLGDRETVLETYTPYGGLFPYQSLNLKQPIANSFNTEALSKHPGKCAVQLTNKSLLTGLNIGGKISLAGERDLLNSGDIVYTIRDRSHVSRTDQRELQGMIHNKWNNDNEFKLTEPFYISENVAEYPRDAYFNDVNTVSITTNASGAVLEFHDPWYYDDETQIQPDCFHPVTTVQHDVFLNQNPNFEDYIPIYRLKAPKFVADIDGIYVFDRWFGAGVDFGGGDTSTISRETPVVFKQSGAAVTAHYTSASATGVSVYVESGEILTIPANANILCADGFTIDVQPYGTLIADGSSGQIILSGDCMATTLNDPIIDEVAGIYGVPSSEMKKLISVSVNGDVQLRSVKIEGYHVGLYAEADHFLTLKNVEIADCNIGIYVDSNAGLSTLEIDSCHIHHCDIGIYFHPEVYDENVLIHHSLFHDIDCYGLFVYYGNGSSAQSVNFLDHPINLLVDFCSFIDCGIDDSYNSDYRSGILICNNSVYDSYFYGQINAYVRNSIFYNAPFYSNDDEEDYIDLNGVKNIYYLSGYDWPEAFGVYPVNPYFVDYGSGDFRISENSYAVDHGTFANPLSGIFPNYSYTTDPDGTAPDIGAIYFPQVTISGGDFSGDIASYGKVTVVGNMNLTGNVFVPEPVEMVIPAGKTVSAASDKSIDVYGKLVVNGNSQSPVDFNNVSINVGMDGNADMEYANITSAGLQVSYGKVNLSHCSIINSDNNTDGLCALYLNPTSSIENCSFVNNSRYGAYMMGGITWLEDCEISGHNNCSGLRLANYNGVLQNNWITDNYDGIAFISGNANLNGGYYSEDQVTGLGSVNEAILNNIIANNTRYGISISNAATPIVGTTNYWEPDDEIWFGGSNAFFAAGGDYYIYSANSSTVYARSNFWDQTEVSSDAQGFADYKSRFFIDKKRVRQNRQRVPAYY